MALVLQKANFWKRISAWMFDAVMTIVITTAFAIPTLQILHYDANYEQFAAIRTEYTQTVAQELQFDLNVTQEQFDEYTDEQKTAYNEQKTAVQTEVNKRLEQDDKARALSSKIISILVTAASISALITFLAWYFALPLVFKHGRTLGKKIFGLAVMRTNHVKITTPVLFARSIVGLYAMETMAVALLCTMGSVGIFAAMMVQVLQIFVMLKTPTHSSIHDLLSDSVVVDYSSQLIFDSQAELEEHVAREKAEEEAAKNGQPLVETSKIEN